MSALAFIGLVMCILSLLAFSFPQRQLEPIPDIRAMVLQDRTHPILPLGTLRRRLAVAPVRRRVLTNGLTPTRRVAPSSCRSQTSPRVMFNPLPLSKGSSPVSASSRRRSSTPSFTLLPTVREESVGVAV
ncbi:hypothetical protein B0H10DRAFT_2213373 [Mycena sp. CBHHK59/15]|nr:hypothetical protein B0H10DRAFT_2213373 [Mycena sp. CBHHK59/15]